MEASAIMKMVEDAFYNLLFIIDVIVRDDDITMWAVLKYQSKVSRGQVMNSSKGNLMRKSQSHHSLKIPLTPWRFLLSKYISVINESRAKQCGCTKADALWLMKYWGVHDKKNGEKQLKSWVRHVRFLLNTCLTVITIVLQSGDSIQEHQDKERHAMKQTTNSAANKTTISCIISSRRLFYRFKQTKF